MSDRIKVRTKGVPFVLIPVEIARDATLSHTAFRLYAVLGTYADNNSQQTYVGVQRIAEHLAVHRRTVSRALEELVEAGYLEIDSRASEHGTNIYTLLDGSETCHPRHEGRDIHVTRDVTPVSPLDVTSVSPKLYSVELDSENYVERRLSTTPHTPEIEDLCEHLARAVADYSLSGARLKVTNRWRRDMDLLVRRGPLGREDAEPIPAERVRQAIDFIFTHLADVNRGGFCWAAQVRSPAALRKHWDSLLDAGRRRVVTQSPTIDVPKPKGDATIHVLQIERSTT